MHMFPLGGRRDHPPIDRHRQDLLEEMVAGQSVIHLGCCGHLVQIDEHRRKNIWLHDRILRASSRCAGIDIARDSVAYLTGTLGIKDIHACDITEGLPGPLAGADWDILLVGEILEHVDNPVEFLRKTREHLAGRVGRIIITVPNAMSLFCVYKAARHVEPVNSDHRYSFTPYTLCKVCAMAGLTVTEFHLVQIESPTRLPWAARWVLWRWPGYRSTIVVRMTVA
jgi:2-polyprenyl-3-methyl-5-hydroxy-6-metoxy-1,4-benzoquinol methylase